MIVSDHYGRPFHAEMVRPARNGDTIDQVWAGVAVRVALASHQPRAYLSNGMIIAVEGA